VIDSAAGVTPAPCSAAVAVPPGLAVADTVASAGPTAAGAKWTCSVHEAPTASLAPHVVESSAKSAASGPPMATVSFPDAAAPLLVTV
jgi:hypothetical protein